MEHGEDTTPARRATQVDGDRGSPGTDRAAARAGEVGLPVHVQRARRKVRLGVDANAPDRAIGEPGYAPAAVSLDARRARPVHADIGAISPDAGPDRGLDGSRRRASEDARVVREVRVEGRIDPVRRRSTHAPARDTRSAECSSLETEARPGAGRMTLERVAVSGAVGHAGRGTGRVVALCLQVGRSRGGREGHGRRRCQGSSSACGCREDRPARAERIDL